MIEIRAVDGVRYTVPCSVNPERMDNAITVRFRVERVFRDSYISVYFDDERVQHLKKKVLTPGEMEQITLRKDMIEKYRNLRMITLKVEEA